jgi:CheY-like chemotaxis protein/HPt (histidine-containing phosphotransfer) domain-containing protein
VDTGIGIAPENQDRVFESFTQAEASTTRRFGGTGLGLVISRRLIRLMGGELKLSSALGQGSTFSFTLELPVPIGKDGDSETSANSSPGMVRTLLVDDNPVALAASAAIMQSLGWEVVQAGSGEQAIELVRNRIQQGQLPLHAVFVDWQMPGMDGWQTMRNIRRLYGEGESPAMVLISGQSRAALHQRTEREQALINGYMVKPLTADMFRDTLGHLHDTPAMVTTGTSTGTTTKDAPPLVAKALGGMRILVVEDNAINQQVARELLVMQGADVTLADDGQQGVDAALAARPPFDVVLMDLQMPVMDGLTAARTLRQSAELNQMPIIAMTANVMASDREACLQAGMNDHVGKPFDLKVLVQTLVRHTGWSPRAASAVVEEPVPTSPIASLDGLPWPPGVDVSGALNRMGGNVGLFYRAISAYLKDAQALPERLGGLLRSGALVDARRELHTIKGLSASLGMDALAKLASHAEKLAIAPTELPSLQAACDAFFLHLAQTLPDLKKVAAGLESIVKAGETARHGGRESLDASEKIELVASLRRLQTALEMSDMSAMELHAQLQQSVGTVLEGSMQGLDDAMADLDFELAAAACSRLITLWS